MFFHWTNQGIYYLFFLWPVGHMIGIVFWVLLCRLTRQLQPFNKVMGGLDFSLNWATSELMAGPCSAVAAVWLMAERVQDALSVAATDWHSGNLAAKVLRPAHTHLIFQPPQHQNHRQNIPPWEGCCPCALHILSALQPAKCHFRVPETEGRAHGDCPALLAPLCKCNKCM